eukprot:174947-Amphidinium_carterae.1
MAFVTIGVYHNEPRFLRRWLRDLISTELVATVTAVHALMTWTMAVSMLHGLIPRIHSWNSSALFAIDLALMRRRL